MLKGTPNQGVHRELIRNSDSLLVSFGGLQQNIGMPQFEFYKITEHLNLSKIFLRDLSQCWYQNGVEGAGKSVNSVANFLKEHIENNNYKKVVFFGNSAGGFAAILFGCILSNKGLEVDVVSFSPQTFISKKLRQKYGDDRWSKEIKNLNTIDFFKKKYLDLAKLVPNSNLRVDIYYSNKDLLDVKHVGHLSEHFKSPARINYHEYDFSGHNLVKELRDRGELAKIIKNLFES